MAIRLTKKSKTKSNLHSRSFHLYHQNQLAIRTVQRHDIPFVIRHFVNHIIQLLRMTLDFWMKSFPFLPSLPEARGKRNGRRRMGGAAQLVGEVVQYEDVYRLCYVRGPEGLLIGLAEELRK